MQWGFVRLAAFLLIIEKIGRFLVWLNDEEDSSCDDGSLGAWEGFLEVDSKGFKVIGRGFILTWSCVVSGVAGYGNTILSPDGESSRGPIPARTRPIEPGDTSLPYVLLCKYV
jgi:hypothetical protein